MRRSSKARPTSLDVARAAGVSQATVSMVLSGNAAGRVSDATQERVQRAAQELRYKAHAAARTLRLGRAHTVALVVPDIRNPFFASVLRGASEVARTVDVTVVLLDIDNRRYWQARARTALAAGALDGLLLCAVEPPGARTLAELGPRLVVLDAEAPRFPSVQLDVAGGTAAAARHLLGLGHRRIGYVGASVRHATFQTRAETLRAVLQKAGVALEQTLTAYAPVDPDAVRPVARTLLSQPERPTAVFCDDDLLAAGVYKAARDVGLSIPGDLSVVGFDDIALARLLEPELTTVAVPAERLGGEGMQRLLAVLDGRAIEPSRPLALHLVVRGSTAPPRQ